MFGWHSRSTNAASVANGRSGGYYGLESQAADTTIFVAPDASGEDDGERFWTHADVPFARDMYEVQLGVLHRQPGAADANGCVQYEGCDAGYPVVWCYEAAGTHRQPSFSSTEIWKFFSQF